jgi:hypothetical protein
VTVEQDAGLNGLSAFRQGSVLRLDTPSIGVGGSQR